MSVDALARAASSVLSYATVVGSLNLKTPQVVKIARAGNADGVSLDGALVECVSYAIACSWGVARGLSFKDYGESAIVSFQLAALVLLVGRHQGRLAYAAVVGAATTAAGALFAANRLPRRAHAALLASQALFNLGARLPQILLNRRTRSTGQLSHASYALAFVGGAVRLFTTAMNVRWADGKAVMLGQFALATALNGVILLQMRLYAASTAAAVAPAADGAAPAAVAAKHQ
jgi:mannose-P-dolichol utilization defect protein 1